jgi:hypothetical protein
LVKQERDAAKVFTAKRMDVIHTLLLKKLLTIRASAEPNSGKGPDRREEF